MMIEVDFDNEQPWGRAIGLGIGKIENILQQS